MKQKFKIGKVCIQGIKTSTTNTGTEVIDLKENLLLEGVEVEVDVALEEIKENFSNFKEICSGVKELYLFIKDELVSGEAAKINNALNKMAGKES